MIYEGYSNMTALGKQVGLTSHKLGKLLVKAGLRTATKVPSDVAIKYGFVRFVPNGRNDALYPIWHRDSTFDLLGKLELLPVAERIDPGK